MNEFNYTAVNFNGETQEAIEYDGRTFIRPWFTGQAVGWVRERFADWENAVFIYCLSLQKVGIYGIRLNLPNRTVWE
jgi:hypothetical protein